MKKPFLITAGPTREAIDPVRYLGNRSSGRMGFALAQAAVEAGYPVRLIAGPVDLPTPCGVHRTDVESAEEMAKATHAAQAGCGFCIFAAAVCDFRPAEKFTKKFKRENCAEWKIVLLPTRDILAESVARREPGQILVGFAAETNELSGNAHAKLIRKGCDLLVANDVSRADIGFSSLENEVTLFFKNGRILHMHKDTKIEIARRLVTEILNLQDCT